MASKSARSPARSTSKVKAIANGGLGSPKTASETSSVGQSAMANALSPREAFETNIHVRKAIQAIADNISKASGRYFSRRSGDEITSGAAYEWLRKNITYRTIRDLISWYNLEGEMAGWRVPGSTIVPQKFIVLDPGVMKPNPTHVKNIEYVTEWRYEQPYVLSADAVYVELPADQVAFAKNWNPNSNLRGSSPCVTGAQEIAQNYFQGRFNSALFQNGVSKDLIVRFPRGTKKDVADQWIKQWTEKHSIFAGNAFKIAALIGDEIQVEEPGTTARDGQFIELRDKNSADITALFGVPPIVSGDYANAKYDSAPEQLEGFFENTLLPQMTMVTEFIQTQVIDLCFRGAAGASRKEKPHLGPQMRKAMERAFDDRTESDLIYLLDPDTLPIASKLKINALNTAELYRKTMAVSFADAATWAGVDRVSNDADDLIYIDNAQQQVAAKEPEPVVPAIAEPVQETTPEAKAALDHIATLARQYRSLVLEAIAQGKAFAKADALALAKGNEQFTVAIHRDYLAIKSILNSEGDKVAIAKAYLNEHYKKAALKTLVGE